MENNKIMMIDYLKFFACILITNSHCSNFYPFPYLAIGGSFGNSLFFVISGYCLANITLSFEKWYFARMKRLFPSLFIMIIIGELVLSFCDTINNITFREKIVIIIDRYWFVFAITLFYIFYYLLFKNYKYSLMKKFMILYVIFYVLIYFSLIKTNFFFVETEGFTFIKVYFYFFVFVLGGVIRREENSINRFVLKNKVRLVFLNVISFVSWAVIYYMTSIMQKYIFLQGFIHVSICVWVFTFYILALLFKGKDKIINFKIDRLIGAIAMCTLEIYIVQVTFIQYIPKNNFPIGLVLFWSLAIGGGWIYNHINKKFLV